MLQHLEFSKIIVRRTLLIFLVHTVLTLAVIFFRPVSASYAVSLISATVPLYVVIFGGYFGKAGLENYNKIKYWDIQKTPLPDDGVGEPSQVDG